MRPVTTKSARCMAVAAMFGIGLLVSPAFSQGAGAPPPPPPGKGGDLGGPPVPPGSREGDGEFGGQGKPGRRGQGAPGEMRGRMMEGALWMRTLEGMKDSMPADQWSGIEKERDAFKAQMTKWQEANGKRLRELMGQMREARENGGQPDKATFEEMQKLNETRPKMEESQQRIFGMLTPEQQETFKKKLAENEAKAKERRGSREGGPGEGGAGKGPRGGKGGKGGKDAPPPPPPPHDGDGNPPPPPMDE